MTTTTAPGISLDWVTTADHGHDRPCDYGGEPCSRQATHVATYRRVAGNCVHFRSRILYCLIHRDLILRQATRRDGLFQCRRCAPGVLLELTGMEALR